MLLLFSPPLFRNRFAGSSRAATRRTSCCSTLLLLTSSLLQNPITGTRALSSSYFGSSNKMALSFVTTRNDETVTVSPKNEAEQSALVVIAHGLGDSAEGFVDVAEMLARKMPYVKFVLPTAPVQPVTLNGGMRMNSWYDIVGLDERSNENCVGIEESRSKLATILETEHQATGLSYSRMVLAGFSQGGALALYTGLQLPPNDDGDGGESRALAGIAIMSGYLPAAKQFKISPGLEGTPVFHGHGTADMVVSHSLVEKSRKLVVEKGLEEDKYTVRSYPIGHTVAPDELLDVRVFLEEVLPPDDTCRIKLKPASEMSVKELRLAVRKAGLASKAVGLVEKAEFIRLVQDHRDGKL